ncbi:MAG: DUF1571 domain-containing protein, partial [Planctomycetota bacterium]
MSELVTKPETADSASDQKLKPAGWMIRILSLLVVVIATILLAAFLYQDVFLSAAPVEEPDGLMVVAENSIATKTPDNSQGAEQGPRTESVVKMNANSVTATITQEMIDNADHPLDPVLEIAKKGALFVEDNIADYTANITKQVRWNGKLQPESKVFCKIRHHRKSDDGKSDTPFSVYTQFIYPKKGQEAIWVEGWHEGKLLAHGPPGLFNLMTVYLDPEGSMAMNGNRYPITAIGMLNLIKKMAEKGSRDRKYGDCQVKMTRNVMLGGARCTCFEVIHEKQEKHFEFHRAEIFIDDDRNLPIAFSSYLWPDQPNGKPKLLERYYYTNINTNVGLTDVDFDPANKAYKFP